MSTENNDLKDLDEQLEQEPKKDKPSKATMLVNLALDEGAELFHTPEGEAFATVPIDGRRETWPLKTKTIRRWLARLFYLSSRRHPGRRRSRMRSPCSKARRCSTDWSTPSTCGRPSTQARSTSTSPTPSGVRWRSRPPAGAWSLTRPSASSARGMLPLPTPVGGGSLEELRPFLNYASEGDFRLMVSWLVMALRPVGPYPVLALHGEQGSGKSTAAEALRMIVDPNEALLRPPPRDERDLVIAGPNSRIVCLENLSVIQPWLSDALCRIATGSGFATRELYTDSDEAIFFVQLPIVLNGIVEVVIAGDLQDRSIVLTLPTIEEYASEDDLWDAFEMARPRILGALLDVVSHAMAHEQTVEIAELPRMADYARWTAAAGGALDWDAEELLAAYTDNRAAANETTLDASPLVAPIRELGEFEGSATELLAALVEIVGEGPARAKHWPKAPHVLSGALRRLAPNLRRADPPIAIEFDREGPTGRRVIRVRQMEWVRKEASVASVASEASATDGTDATDARLHTHSNGPAPPNEVQDLARGAGIELVDEEP